MRQALLLRVLSALVLASFARPASAEPQLSWRPEWHRFAPAEYAATGVLLLGTGALIVAGDEGGPNWRGPVLFDEPLRDTLRGRDAPTRSAAQTAGDALYYGGLAYPYVVDVVAVAWVARGSPDVAAQMALIDSEAFAITGFFSFLANATLKRERPSRRECGDGKPDPIFPGCSDPGSNEGFYSGHTGIAFTGAALTCMHHQYLPLYGRSKTGGTIACFASMGGAVATGTLRVISDQHYASDVIAGAAVGLASGLLVPLFHYRSAGPTFRGWSALPSVSPSSAGLALRGGF
jgi:membrane-associated phospholipid phosphatase